ncbi:MAG: heparinase II/III family protein, partial [Candidatus Hodarchaeales archaeon]
FGENAKITWDNLSVRETLSGAKSFPDAGWYIIRHESDYCIVSCGPNGGDGWHSHNDKLSFELVVDGQDIIVDPGTYVYTSFPKERNKFRSTEYHNTIKFNEHEQNPVNEEMIFFLPDKVTIVKAELNETENKIVFQGIIQYAGISHERIITIDKDSSKWKITDSFSSSNHIDARMLFHLSPHLTSEGNNILKKETREKIATLEVESYSLKKSKYEYSPEYGVKIKGECLVVNIPAINDITSVTTHIYSIK